MSAPAVTSPRCPLRDWTGGEATALRKALRLSQARFARVTGSSVRTVANWAGSPETVPRSAAQDALDALLADAPPAVKARFEELAGAHASPAANPAEGTDTPVARVVSLEAHPRFRADYKALAIGQVTAARTALGLTPAEFAAWLGNALGRPLREGAVDCWEQKGIMPPSDAVMAAQACLAGCEKDFGRTGRGE